MDPAPSSKGNDIQCRGDILELGLKILLFSPRSVILEGDPHIDISSPHVGSETLRKNNIDNRLDSDSGMTKQRRAHKLTITPYLASSSWRFKEGHGPRSVLEGELRPRSGTISLIFTFRRIVIIKT